MIEYSQGDGLVPHGDVIYVIYDLSYDIICVIYDSVIQWAAMLWESRWEGHEMRTAGSLLNGKLSPGDSQEGNADLSLNSDLNPVNNHIGQELSFGWEHSLANTLISTYELQSKGPS